MFTYQKSTKQSNTNILFTCRKLKQISYSDSSFNLPNYVIISKEETITKKLIEKTNCAALCRKFKYATKRYLHSVICEERIVLLKRMKISRERIKSTDGRNTDRFHTEIVIFSPSKYFNRIV